MKQLCVGEICSLAGPHQGIILRKQSLRCELVLKQIKQQRARKYQRKTHSPSHMSNNYFGLKNDCLGNCGPHDGRLGGTPRPGLLPRRPMRWRRPDNSLDGVGMMGQSVDHSRGNHTVALPPCVDQSVGMGMGFGLSAFQLGHIARPVTPHQRRPSSRPTDRPNF